MELWVWAVFRFLFVFSDIFCYECIDENIDYKSNKSYTSNLWYDDHGVKLCECGGDLLTNLYILSI